MLWDAIFIMIIEYAEHFYIILESKPCMAY